MNNVLRLALLLMVVATVAVLSCWLTNRFLHGPRASAQSADSHDWIHRELNITAAQDQTLTAVEERYAQRRRELTEIIRLANQELAQAILEEGFGE